MIRIHLDDRQHRPTIKVEGDIAGIFVSELEHVWQDLARTSQPVTLDMKGVIHIDREGRLLLRAMHAAGVSFRGSQLALQDLLD